MPLFWIVHTVDKEPTVFIQEASYIMFARLKAMIAGHKGDYVEFHELDAKTAKKVPKKMIGRVLEQSEANALLGRIG